MKKIFLFFTFIFSCIFLQAQHKVTFILKEETTIRHDSIFVTGSFSNWDSTANPSYLFKPHGENEKSLTLDIMPGSISYRFHRGSWASGEKKYNGDEVDDRKVIIKRDTVLSDVIDAWQDEFFQEKYKALTLQKSDTSQLKIIVSMAFAYVSSSGYFNPDSALYYGQRGLQLIQKMKLSGENEKWFVQGNAYAIIAMQEVIAAVLHSLGNFPKALELHLDNIQLAEKEKDKFGLAYTILNTLGEYEAMKDYQHILFYGNQIDSIISTEDRRLPAYTWLHREAIYRKAIAFYNLHQLDSALYYAKKRTAIDLAVNNKTDIIFGRITLADIYAALGNKDSATENYRYVIANTENFVGYIKANAQAGMARLFQKENRFDSALLYARQALSYFQNNKNAVQSWAQNPELYIAEIGPLVAELYKDNNQPDSAYKYLQYSIAVKDSLYNADKITQFQTLSFNEANRRQQSEQQILDERQRYNTKIKMYGLISIITGFVVLAFVLYRNNRQKQKANIVLQNQKQEIETTLGELKNTQKQLIQSEKMASLGELTAGIAHEIQNPLNFVNNFSDVSRELIDELEVEKSKAKSERDETIEAEILNDIKQNLEKINHHGKRADAIVKGMLQHSQKSTGEKTPTDINALCDEYLRLSYHGLRAKDKNFNATLKTDFDESIGKINIIQQDIGRVLLNLYNNAFYAASLPLPTGQAGFKGGFSDSDKSSDPNIWVSTKKVNDKVEIRVADNGIGIPQNIVDKIFQPFFTTKPTGQGTGLGLSLAYDIVKAHGGDIKVETKEGEGTTFTIQLPAITL